MNHRSEAAHPRPHQNVCYTAIPVKTNRGLEFNRMTLHSRRRELCPALAAWQRRDGAKPMVCWRHDEIRRAACSEASAVEAAKRGLNRADLPKLGRYRLIPAEAVE